MSDNLPANERPTRTEPPAFRFSGPAWGGLALIGIGAIFLLQTMGLLPTNFNWWALFILFPGVSLLYQAWRMSDGGAHFDHRVRGPLIGGTAVTLVALIFLFNLDWGIMWPVFLILAGILVFATAAR